MIKEQLYELTVEDENVDGVFAISLVESPAIEMDFVYFGKDVKFSTIDNEKRLLMGPILVPDKKILRVDGAGQPYYVFFKPETIKRLSELYLEKKLTDKATLEHDKNIDGVNLVESWIVDDPKHDKQQVFGMDYPKGTWMVSMKILDDAIWQKVKDGKLNGFSVQGYFLEKAKFSKDNTETLEKIKDILKQFV